MLQLIRVRFQRVSQERQHASWRECRAARTASRPAPISAPLTMLCRTLSLVETVEHHLPLCVRHVVTVPVGDEQDIGSAGGPNTTEPKHD